MMKYFCLMTSMQTRFEESLKLFYNRLVIEMKDITDKNSGRLSVVLVAWTFLRGAARQSVGSVSGIFS
jgi:hypothetical protein